MKKLLIIIIMLFSSKVYGLSDDTEKTKTYLSGVYYNQIRDGEHHWAQSAMFSVDGDVIYCISPGMPVNSLIYSSSDSWNATGISKEKTRTIELIGYYGYNYPSHRSKYYYMAAQKLIWEELGVENAYFTTGSYGNGSIINIDNYIEEINRLIENHYLMPSFSEHEINASYNEKLILNDYNNVLSNYEIDDSNGNDVSINGNSIEITAIKSGLITLKKKSIENSIIYLNEGSQTFANMGNGLNDVIFSVNLNVINGTIKVKTFTEKDEPIEGSMYLLEKDEEKIYGISDSNGVINFINLDKGNYKLKQLNTKAGYNVISNELVIYIDERSFYHEKEISNQEIKRRLIINKFYGDNSLGLFSKEEGIKFNIYKDGTLYDEVITDKSGMAISNLNYGNYIIKQINYTNGYEKVKETYVTIDNSVINEVILNLYSNIIKKEEVDQIVFDIPKTNGYNYINLLCILIILLMKKL